MDRIQAIKNRTLSHNDLAKIQAMASVSDPLVIAEELPDAPVHLEVKKEVPEAPAVDDVAFYGPRVMAFYKYFSKQDTLWPPHVSATLALAACTLKSCVVIGQSVTDAHSIKISAIPVKAENPVIPAVAKKKRGRPPKVK